MEDHGRSKRGFHHTGAAWYSKILNDRSDDVVDEVSIGLYLPDGGTTGEFLIRWRKLAGDAVPQLCAFDDSWDALRQCADLIDKLAEHDNENMTPLALCDLLKECGFEDMTQRERQGQTKK